MAGNDHDISTLNSLIATTIDSIEGYAASAEDAENGRYASLFTARADERRQVASLLQAEVRRLGGEPSEGGTALGGAHRLFVNLKAAVTGQDDQAVVNEVERGEDHIKAKFEDAIKDQELSAETRAVIEAGYRSVREGHDQMRDLKHSLQNSN
ncbi:MAG TPA: PA2169 family four-helix-bundle protein [Sphingomonas sp.]|nr:PA2169 family four-helix-bundle protein [Sphingomonas sp.]